MVQRTKATGERRHLGYWIINLFGISCRPLPKSQAGHVQRFGRRPVPRSCRISGLAALAPDRRLVGAHPDLAAGADSGGGLSRQWHVVHDRRPRGQRRFRKSIAAPMRSPRQARISRRRSARCGSSRAISRSSRITRRSPISRQANATALKKLALIEQAVDQSERERLAWLAPRLKEIARRFTAVADEQRKLGFTDSDGLRRRLRDNGTAVERLISQSMADNRRIGSAPLAGAAAGDAAATRPSNASSPRVFRKPCSRANTRNSTTALNNLYASPDMRSEIEKRVQAYVDAFRVWSASADTLRPQSQDHRSRHPADDAGRRPHHRRRRPKARGSPPSGCRHRRAAPNPSSCGSASLPWLLGLVLSFADRPQHHSAAGRPVGRNEAARRRRHLGPHSRRRARATRSAPWRAR